MSEREIAKGGKECSQIPIASSFNVTSSSCDGTKGICKLLLDSEPQ